MGLFSFGGSKQSSSSRSVSSSFDNLDAFGIDFGFDTSVSRSESGGQSSSFDRAQSGSRQRVAFEDVFANLFGSAGGAASRVAGQTGSLTSAANLLFNSGGDIIEQLRGGGAGADFLKERLANRDGLADEQIGQLGDDLARFLAEKANPAITAGGVSAGTLGGSRGEVQRGIAERGAAEAFTRGSTDIRLADQAARDSIASTLMASEADRGAASLGSLPSLFGLAESGVMAELSPYLALSQILGPQLALTESASSSVGGSQSTQFSQALAEALGLNFGMTEQTGRAGSSSLTTSRSSGKSLSLGFS